MAAVVAHIEAGLGEVLRRLEKKVEAVAGLMDQVRACAAAEQNRPQFVLCGQKRARTTPHKGRRHGAARLVYHMHCAALRVLPAPLRPPPPPLAPHCCRRQQNAMELLEAHLAGGLLKLEGRLAGVEEAAAAGVPQQRGQQSDGAHKPGAGQQAGCSS